MDTNLQVMSEAQLAQIASQLDADLAAEIAAGHIELQPSRWTVISGGVPGFVNANDKEQMARTLQGVILAYQPVRTLWDPNTPQGVKAYPLCRSRDAKIGEPQSSLAEFGGSMEPRPCAGCPFDRWGTGKNGRGKACKEKEALVIYPIDESSDPRVVYAPPTSLSNFDAYKGQLAGGNHPASRRLFSDNPPAWAKNRGNKRTLLTWYVITELGTELRGTGQEAFSLITFRPVSLIEDSLAVKIKDIRNEWGIKVAEVEADMYAEMANEEAGQPFDSPPIEAEPVPF